MCEGQDLALVGGSSFLLCGCRDTAAVASARAGQLYGLEALDESIQDNRNNITRFLVLSRDPRVQVRDSDHAGQLSNLAATAVAFFSLEAKGMLRD